LAGTTQLPFWKSEKADPPGKPPLEKAHAVAPVAVVVSAIGCPAVRGAPAVVCVKAGNGVMARLDP